MAAKRKPLSAEETAAWVHRAKASEAELRERLAAELGASKTAELRVSETWRKVLRLAKVRAPRAHPHASPPPWLSFFVCCRPAAPCSLR